MLPFEDETSLSMLFHLNSEPWGNTEAYQDELYEVEYKDVVTALPELPLPQPPETVLTRLARERASCRAFAMKALPLRLLSAILWGSYGISRSDRTLLRGSLALLRPIPSAGGLFPLEIYILSQRADDLPDGLHHYNVRHHSLETTQIGPLFEQFEPSLFMYDAVKNANVILFLSAVFKRTQKKYGPRGYRYILLEAGHLAQNVCLLAAEAGLSTLCMGGYADGGVNRLLGLRPRDEGVVYSVAVGWPQGG
jgi:SagB-type dehydrogenase family enzyme